MKKTEEISDPNSCFNRALPEEPMFVLLGRDASAPDVLRRWASDRVERGKNQAGDQQIVKALKLAEEMERYLADKHSPVAMAGTTTSLAAAA